MWHAHEKHEHLEQECHALWTHIEARLETRRGAQIFESLVLSLNILAHALEFLSKRVLHAYGYQRITFNFFSNLTSK